MGMKLKVGCTCKACKKKARKQISANYTKLKRHERQRVRIALLKGDEEVAPYGKAINETYA